LTRTDEARIHLRDCPGDDSNRAALEASLRFSRGLGAKSSCEVKKILSEDEELLLENSIVCIAGFVDWHKTEYLGGISCVQFPHMRRDWQHHNFGFWVMGSLPLVPSASKYTQNHNYDRKCLSYSFGLLVLGQQRWRRSEEHLHRAAEFLAQIPKPMPRVASGLAGPKFRGTHVWARESSQSSCVPTAQDGNGTQNSWREMAGEPKTYGGKISQIQLSMIPGQYSASSSGYTEHYYLPIVFCVLGLQPRFHRFRSTHGRDGCVSTRALCFQLERKLG
jgi:hypothetical protein